MTSFVRSLTVLGCLLAGSAAAVAAQPTPQAGGFVQAPQKPMGSGVTIQYRLLDPVAVGRPTRVEVMLGRIKDPAGASARFTAEASLELQSNAGPFSFAPGQDGLLQITVVPRTEGLAYLNLFVTQRGATSSTAIAIQAGDANAAASAKAPASGTLKDLPEGGKILSMPVK